MRIIVSDDTGKVIMGYDTDFRNEGLCPGLDQAPAVAALLQEAASFLGTPPPAGQALEGIGFDPNAVSYELHGRAKS
jgi:hypothetical protein